MAIRLRTRLNRLERRHAQRGLREPSLEALVRDSAALDRWLAQAGYDSPHAALAAGVRTPGTFRHVTIETKAQAVEQARLWRRQRGITNPPVQHAPKSRPYAVATPLTDGDAEANPARRRQGD
jgi:hypothetical protein